MIRYKEMSKRAKINIVVMFIAGIMDMAISYITGNLWTFLIGIMFLLDITDIYMHENDKKTIEEYEIMLDQYHDLVGKQNIMIWKLRGEVKNGEDNKI